MGFGSKVSDSIEIWENAVVAELFNRTGNLVSNPLNKSNKMGKVAENRSTVPPAMLTSPPAIGEA